MPLPQGSYPTGTLPQVIGNAEPNDRHPGLKREHCLPRKCGLPVVDRSCVVPVLREIAGIHGLVWELNHQANSVFI